MNDKNRKQIQKWIDNLEEIKTGIETNTANEPLTCVAIGTGKYVEYLDTKYYEV